MSQRGIYSELKPAWWYAKEGGLPAAPKQVQLILSDLCNQDCHFCAYRMSGYTSNQLFVGDSELSKWGTNNPNRKIPAARALSLLEEFKEAGVEAVQFTGGGEPTVHKKHEEIFTRCLDLGMKASLVSNGISWSKDLRTKILPRFSWVRVSIDAGNVESYAHIRRTSKYNWVTAWDNIADLADAIDTENSRTALGLGFVVTPHSWTEIPEFACLARESGADNIRFTAMFSTEDEDPYIDIYEKIVSLINNVRMTHQSDLFKVHDNFGSRFEDLKQHSPDYRFCSYQYYTAYVGGDLTAYRCCVLSYNERGKINQGDLSEQSFNTFWNSAARKEDMAGFDARECERCQFNQKNRAVNYLMATDPLHKEFP
jgi:MoaA/NifB/PqqE/SkfB family radical SAM enzyme